MRAGSSCNTAGAEGCRMASVGQGVYLAPQTFEVKPCGSNLVVPIALYPLCNMKEDRHAHTC